MKTLCSLLVMPALMCGLAFAQYEKSDNDEQRERAANEKITHGPVVEAVGSTWATVAWSTNTGGSSVVRYGTEPNRLDRMAESPYVVDRGKPGETHRVKLNNLRPGTTYYYIVDSGQGQGTGTEAHSRVEQFTTHR